MGALTDIEYLNVFELDLAKHTTVYGLAAMTANIREGAVFLTGYVPKPCYAG